MSKHNFPLIGTITCSATTRNAGLESMIDLKEVVEKIVTDDEDGVMTKLAGIMNLLQYADAQVPYTGYFPMIYDLFWVMYSKETVHADEPWDWETDVTDLPDFDNQAGLSTVESPQAMRDALDKAFGPYSPYLAKRLNSISFMPKVVAAPNRSDTDGNKYILREAFQKFSWVPTKREVSKIQALEKEIEAANDEYTQFGLFLLWRTGKLKASITTTINARYVCPLDVSVQSREAARGDEPFL